MAIMKIARHRNASKFDTEVDVGAELDELDELDAELENEDDDMITMMIAHSSQETTQSRLTKFLEEFLRNQIVRL